ncbi:MAG: Stp1/IreP family PP2C-type Ser/Thr phosphatase [SAR202 cluster bacterium]|nr:Stp1/IreP family PP2C-type Ser/Thr phosphatase [SAR202 cluster bacterium]
MKDRKPYPISRIEIVGATDVGQKRSRNEDSFRIIQSDDCPNNIDGVLIVADGMGGHAAGDVASQIAVDTFVGEFEGFETKDAGDILVLLGDALIKANSLIYAAGRQNTGGSMGTTCTAAVISRGKVHIAHSGDSRGYMQRDKELSQLTDDHSWVAQLVKEGHITPEQARVHPNRNVITKALGIENELVPDIITEEIQTGDTILLCSDGLHGLVEDEDISETLDELPIQDALDALIQLANDKGGDDNITAVVVAIH